MKKEDVLEIDKATAIRLFPSAAPELKDAFVKAFGSKTFSQKITDRVQSFEDACALVGANSADDRFCSGTPDTIAYEKLKVIVKALNEGWKPDWNNEDQYKWGPWFRYSGSGFRFYASCYVITITYSSGGSRLCFKSKELSDYAAEQFISLYNQFIN